MIANTAVFTCSICGEASANICAYCTKDACSNHRCARCKRCSDCCECEVPLGEELPVAELAGSEAAASEAAGAEAALQPILEPEILAPTPAFDGGVFLTPEEASVFVQPFEDAPRAPSTELFAAEEPPELPGPSELPDPHEPHS
jgi:hypothetical protein